MATYTSNLNLKKPSTGEKYDVIGDLNDAKDKIDLAVGNIAGQVEDTANRLLAKQDWYEVFKNMKVKNTDGVLVRKVSEDQFDIFINHHKNIYQRWMLSRSIGLDNSVTSHSNNDAWQVNSVKNTLIGTEDKVQAIDVEMTRSGSWTNYGGIYSATSVGAYMETTIYGEDVIVYGTFRNNGGLAQLTIDGVDYGMVDFYDPSTGGTNLTKHIATGLSEAEHVVRLTVTGTKNPLSSGTAIRVGSISAIAKVDLNLSETTAINFVTISMPSNRDFRYGQSAIELAIHNTYEGNSVWSGTYHKYLYPKIANGQKIYMDGIAKGIEDFVIGRYYVCRDMMVIQDLTLANGVNAIADVQMMNHFTKDGYHVKWNLEWTKAVQINTSYSGMYGTSVDRMILGDTQKVNYAIFDDAEHEDVDTFTMIGWQSQDDYIVGFKALNENAMAFVNTPKGMYYRDRTFDMKMYLHRFAGNVAIGDKWKSEFIVSIAKCNNAELVMAQ